MRVAALQMNSGPDVSTNLDLAGRLISEAAADDCVLVVLPENFALMPEKGTDKAKHAEQPGEGPIQDFLAEASKRHGVWVVAGSIPLVSPEIAAERVYGACPVYDSKGKAQALYRKIHLFDVDLVDNQESYRESHSMYPGDDVVAVDTPCGRVGLTICYDLRFPELFRRLVDDGATVFTVPAAFTLHTGKDHWDVLLRARAIENQCFVVAPAQCGRHSEERASHGRSMIVDPWGLVLAQGGDRPCVIVADCDPAELERVRGALPALRHRVL